MDSGSSRRGGAQTLPEVALSSSRHGSRAALRQLRAIRLGGQEADARTVSYEQLEQSAIQTAAGLIALGVQRGQTVAVFASTRTEWTIFELGVACAGAVLVPIYHTSSPPECAHVLAHSQAKVALCEDALACAKVQEVAGQCPDLEHVLILEGETKDALPLAELVARGRRPGAEDEVRARVAEVQPDDLATIVYTSGTTGRPKGCLLTHRNLMATARMYAQRLQLAQEHAVIYMFLPLAHVLARLAFAWALEVGRRARSRERASRRHGPLARARLRLAERIGLTAVKGIFGGRLELALVGAAPADRRLLEFFDCCGALVLEGYGLSESSAAATLNPIGAPRFGTTGTALPGTAVRIAGEIAALGRMRRPSHESQGLGSAA